MLQWQGIEPWIAGRRTPHARGPEKIRWVVGRTIGRLKGPRRLRVRYARLGAIIDAWTTIAASVIRNRTLYNDTI